MHSILAPSSAAVWGPCAGSVLMELQYPEDKTTESAIEGDKAHFVGMNLISKKQGTPVTLPEYSPEIMQGAELYAADVARVMQKTKVFGGVDMGVEVKIDCSAIHPECFGTPDAWLYDARGRTLYIWDFKFGRRVVEVYQNKQMTVYLAGLLALVGQVDHIEATIVQPRASHPDGPIRRWRTTPADIGHDIGSLSASAAEALGNDPLCVPGPHCRYCRGRHACQAANYAACAASEFAVQPIPHELTPAALGLELQLIEDAEAALKSRRTGIAAQVESLIRGGANVPGYIMRQSNTHRQWSVPHDDLVALGVPGKPVTPNQAEIAGVDPEIVAVFTEKPPGAMKLKRDDGTRVQHIFGQKEAK